MRKATAMQIPADAVNSLPEADWVEAAKFTMVIASTGGSHALRVAMLGVMTMLMYSYVPSGELLVWASGSMLVAILQYVFCKRFAKLSASESVHGRISFVRKNLWIWPLQSAVWLSATYLLLGRMPPELQGICWMLLAGIVGVAVLRLSAHMGITRLFLVTAILTLLMSVGARLSFGPADDHEIENLWLVGLLGIYLIGLFKVASMQNEVHAGSIDLRYHNARLIQSLVQQTRVAREAIIFKDRFLASAAHDLKQPVNALTIYAEWLMNEPESSPELAPKVFQAARAVNTLFDSMFDLVKLDAGHFGVNLRSVSLRKLLSDLEVQFRPAATEKGLELRIRMPREVVLQSDPALLQRVLGNLLTNAIRYTRQGGVLLAVRPERSGWRIEVWDTGLGIAPALQSRIFGEFYKVQSHGTEEGFGLGLSIVKRLSSLLNYRVSVRSRAGKGSVFCVHIPKNAKT